MGSKPRRARSIPEAIGWPMTYWDLSYEVYCEWCAAKGDVPPRREWYEEWMYTATYDEKKRLRDARIENEREERGEQ